MAGDEERPAAAVRSARERIMALRAPSMDEGLGLEALTGKACSCRKPKGIEFFRIRPGEDWTLQLCLYVEKAGDAIPDGFYAIAPPLAKYLPGAKMYDLRYGITKNGAAFLLPIPWPTPGLNDRHRQSLLRAAKAAETAWIRIEWNKATGSYDEFTAMGDFGDPVWPDTAIPDVDTALEISFADKIVDDENDPVVRRALGLE